MPLFFSSNKLSQLTDDGTTLTIKSTGSSYVRIGDAGTTNHSLNSNDDLLVSGELEVTGQSFFDSQVNMSNNIKFGDNNQLKFGAGADNLMFHSTTQTPNSFTMTTGSESNAIIISEVADAGYDFAHAQQTNPTLFIQSANQSATEWISFTHDQTDGVIDCGAGTLNLGGTANVNFAGAAVTGSTVSHDAYVELEVAGVLKKFMLGS